MLSKDTASAIRKLRSFVEAVKDGLKNEFEVSRRNLWDYGFNFSSSRGLIYFGSWLQFWEEFDHPLCIAVPEQKSKQLWEAFRERHQDSGDFVSDFRSDDETTKYLVWGIKPTAGSPAESIKQVKRILEEVRALLG